MFRTSFATVMIFLALITRLVAQDFGDGDPYAMLQSNQDFGSQAMAMLDQQIAAGRAYEQQIYQNAMQNPQVLAQYQQFLASGGQASLQDYATRWVQTAGFDPVATQHWNDTMNDINRRDRQNLADTRNYINGLWQDTMQERFHSASRNAQMGGELLSGYSPYNDANGQQWTLPNTMSAGQYATDPDGNTFTVDQSGTYYRYTPYGWQAMTYGR